MRRNLPPFAAVRAFEATARHGTMQAAGGELGITSSAVSHQVRSLEAFVGTALFERAPGRLSLTPTGEAYLSDLSAALDLINTSTARASLRGEAGHLTIHMAASLLELWFVPLLKGFSGEHADLRISVVTEATASDLATGFADISIVYDELDGHDPSEFLFVEEIVPCCSSAYLEAHGPISRPEDLLSHPLIWCDVEPDEWQFWLAHHGVPERSAERWIGFDLRAAALQAAREGLGIAMGRRPYLDAALTRRRLVLPVDHKVSTGYGYRLDISARAKHLPKVRQFSKWLHHACAE